MGWKDWPYWFKYAVTFSATCLVISFIPILSFITIFTPLFFAHFFIDIMLLGFKDSNETYLVFLNFIGYLFVLIFWGVIGALIGFIYGKIKNRNNN